MSFPIAGARLRRISTGKVFGKNHPRLKVPVFFPKPGGHDLDSRCAYAANFANEIGNDKGRDDGIILHILLNLDISA